MLKFPDFQNETSLSSNDNPLRVALAVAEEIKQIRQFSTKPIYVLSGEAHSIPAQVLLPYAFVELNNPLGQKKAEPLVDVSRGHFRLGVEFSHNVLTQTLDRVMPHPLDRSTVAALEKTQGTGPGLLTALTAKRYQTSPHANDCLLSAMARHGIETVAVDASRIWSQQMQDDVLDTTDSLTRSFMTVAHNKVSDRSAEGIAVRNNVMAHLLQNKTEAHQVSWLQVGCDHLFGNDDDDLPYQHSLANLFNPLVEQGSAHVIAVFQNRERRFMPPAAERFAGKVITYDGLDSGYSSDLEEYSQTGQLIGKMHARLGHKKPPEVPYLGEDKIKSRQQELINRILPIWTKGLAVGPSY